MTTPKSIIAAALLTDSAATYYTTPAGTVTVIKKLTFYNSDTNPLLVTVYLIAAAGTAGATNLIKAKSVAAGETWECYEAENHILAAGAFIQALAATASKVSIRGSGVEIQI